MREAHLRDAVALCEFLCFLEAEVRAALGSLRQRCGQRHGPQHGMVWCVLSCLCVGACLCAGTCPDIVGACKQARWQR
jgi:hypothetical protein